MSQKKTNFVAQAGILALAGIVCRIIGILYRSPLTGIIGDEGNGYYSTAYNIYTIILLISSYSIPGAISKVISQRLAVKEYKNAHRIFKMSLLYVSIVGLLASLFAFFAAPILVDEYSVVVLRVFAPTIFLSGILGVLRGYFQAHRTMVPTSYSQILEQIFNAVFSILMAFLFMKTSMDALTASEPVKGAMGSALGTGIGVLAALLFMSLIYLYNRGIIRRSMERDRTPARELLNNREIGIIILTVVAPFLLSTFIYNFSISLNQTIFSRILENVKEMDIKEVVTMYGIFSGKSWVIINIPIAFASAMSSAVIPTISTSYSQGNERETFRRISTAIQTTMLLAIPSAVGLAILAEPVMRLLFPQKESLAIAASLLRVLSVSVIFYSLSTLTNAILQGTGLVKKPVINAAIALVVQTVFLVPMLIFTDWNQYALAIAAILYSGSMCLLNALSLKKGLGYRQNLKKSFLLPLASALIMGIATWGSYTILEMFMPSFVLSLVFSIGFSVIIYFMALLLTKALEEEDILALPKGRLILRVARKTHLLR